MLTYSDWCAILRSERLPAALVDLDAFDRNLAQVAALANAGSRPIRLATKSLRVPELVERALSGGAPFRGLMCYSAEEAAFLAERGHDDLLVAYPTLQASDLAALRALHEQGKAVALAVDEAESIRLLGEAMAGVASPFRVVIDCDLSLRLLGGLVHLGVRRSPVRSAHDLDRLLDSASKIRQVEVVGVLAYEAQVAGLADRNPFHRTLGPLHRLVRLVSVRSVARARRRIAEQFRRRGLALTLFNGGGTGSFGYALAEPWLTEVTVGSALYSSHLFDYYSNVRFEPALFFALQAVRSSDPRYVTCQGGGYVASGAAGRDRLPRPWFPEGLELLPMEGAGEVQTPLRLSADVEKVAAGAPVIFRPAKAGEALERFNDVLLVSKGAVVGRAKTYRGFGKCFY